MAEGERRTSIDVLHEATEALKAAKAGMEEIRESLGLPAREKERPALKLVKGGDDA